MSEPISAFAIYSRKRKTTTLPSSVVKKSRSECNQNNATKKISNQKTTISVNEKLTKKKSKKLKKRVVTQTNGDNKNSVERKSIKSKPKKTSSDAELNSEKITNRKQLVKMSNNKNLKNEKASLKFAECQFSKNIGFNDKVDFVIQNIDDPTSSSRDIFKWLIHPLDVNQFFNEYWECKHLHLKQEDPNRYKFLLSTPLLDTILRKNNILFTKNIDITSYTNGLRETHNPSGRAIPSMVWDYYMNGCSVRMLNPQTYIPEIHKLNCNLQELFNCFVGANCYLTPPNSQGFAPHYDDIEAFILQVEGKKRWRLYKPLTSNEILPRYSSKNFDQSQLGKPILDVVLNEGDLLYFPRGTIHQGETIDDTHSLHITLSVYQKNSFGDYLQKLVPQVLESAFRADKKYREGLPLDFLENIGFAYSENSSEIRQTYINYVKNLFSNLSKYVDECLDNAADEVAQSHIHDVLPPVFERHEKKRSAVSDGERMTENGVVKHRVEIELDTRIRLSRRHCMRLVKEEDSYKIYYSTENSKEYHEYEPQFLELSEEFVPAIRLLITSYPKYIRVDDMPIEGEDNKIQIVKDLWEKYIIITKHPLPVLSD